MAPVSPVDAAAVAGRLANSAALGATAVAMALDGPRARRGDSVLTWRTGTKNPHTLYENDEPVGMVIEPRDGERIVAAMNGADIEASTAKVRKLGAEVERLRGEAEQVERGYQHTRVRLAQANALLERGRQPFENIDDFLAWEEDTNAHLAGQAAHQDGCRYERETPALDPDDCPRCAEQVATRTPELRPGCTTGDYYEPARTEACRCCGQQTDRAMSSAPIMALLRILELCWRERHALPSGVVERIREQLEGPVGVRVRADEAVLDAAAAWFDRLRVERTEVKAFWLDETKALHEAELARRGLR